MTETKKGWILHYMFKQRTKEGFVDVLHSCDRDEYFDLVDDMYFYAGLNAYDQNK